jgi:multidrug efflux pump subunit AcrB
LIGGNPFGIIMTGIATISLAGVVVNNAIVLLAYVEDLRRDYGLGLYESLIEAGLTRFRPVLLTAITTILGLVPMVLGISFNFRELRWIVDSESAEWWGPMATSVAVGLAIATVLTLIVVPALYAAIEVSHKRVAGVLGRLLHPFRRAEPTPDA